MERGKGLLRAHQPWNGANNSLRLCATNREMPHTFLAGNGNGARNAMRSSAYQTGQKDRAVGGRLHHSQAAHRRGVQGGRDVFALYFHALMVLLHCIWSWMQGSRLRVYMMLHPILLYLLNCLALQAGASMKSIIASRQNLVKFRPGSFFFQCEEELHAASFCPHF
jgi:hypothetical protein